MSLFRPEGSSAGRACEDFMRIFAAVALLAAGCATAPTANTVATAARPATPAFRVADIENRTAAELDARLGAPALTRIEGGGEFRRYAFSGCSLMIILYPDDRGVKRMQRADAAALVAGADNPSVEDCLASGLAGGR
jgi:hypothetical protein